MHIFEHFKYERPNPEEIQKVFALKIAHLKKAKNAKAFLLIINQIEKLRATTDSMIVLADIRFKINTKDDFYVKEHAFCDKLIPLMQDLSKDYFEVIVNSKFRDDFTKKYGTNVISIMKKSLQTIQPEVLSLLERENMLKSEYTKLLSSAQFDFKGKNMTMGELRALFTSKDRETRKLAQEKFSDFFKEKEKDFDELFDKLVHLRHEIAVILGYHNFIELGYDRLGRVDYGSRDVKQLQTYAKEIYIPFVNKIREWQKEQLHIDRLYYYDDPFYFNEEIVLKGDFSYILKEVEKTFTHMGVESRRFFTFMVKRHLLDLLPKKSKLDWGFCHFIKTEKSPFIFMNYAGSAKNLLTLYHESGHALSDFINRNKTFWEWNMVGLETGEIHSSTMEFFSWPYANRITAKPELFKLSGFLDATLFIPYGLLVDSFQHWVYENPNASIADRKKQWRVLEKVYLPHRNYEENAFLDRGNFWFRQLHIFEMPFYYVDYVIAYFCAFQYLFKSKENFVKAWKDYIQLIKSAVTYGFHDTLLRGNLEDPFQKNTIQKITLKLDTLFQELSKNI